MEALRKSKIRNSIHHVYDGVDAMSFLRLEGKYAKAPRPDLILFDLNLPRKGGVEVLANLKKDKNLKRIPVVVLTVSSDGADIARTCNLHANRCITKPLDLNQFLKAVESIENWWLTVVKVPKSAAREF
jgi:chemotaxis family two-component system response regulator Rcp1